MQHINAVHCCGNPELHNVRAFISPLHYFYIEGKIKNQALNAIEFIIFLQYLEWCFPDGVWQNPRVP
jgi:hypothetical protein